MYTMLVLTLLLFHKGRKHPPSLMLAVYALVEVITNGLNILTLSAGNSFFDQFPVLHFIYKPLYCLWVPLFYFYVRLCFSSDLKPGKKQALHFIPFFSFLAFFLIIWVTGGNQYIRENLYQQGTLLNYSAFAVDVTVKAQYVLYNFLMIRLLFRHQKIVIQQPKKVTNSGVGLNWLRFIVFGYAFASLGAIVGFISYATESPLSPAINLVSISYFFLFFFAIFYSTITSKFPEDTTKPKAAQQQVADLHPLMSRIEELVTEKKMFLEPELTLQQIASELNEKERLISQAINTVQQQNVNEYINSLRVQHACRLLLADKEKPIFEVMYESGFNTKGAFNLAFKKIVGKTPTQYREKE
jgi:AraC-like DNA-binding protein